MLVGYFHMYSFPNHSDTHRPSTIPTLPYLFQRDLDSRSLSLSVSLSLMKLQHSQTGILISLVSPSKVDDRWKNMSCIIMQWRTCTMKSKSRVLVTKQSHSRYLNSQKERREMKRAANRTPKTLTPQIMPCFPPVVVIPCIPELSCNSRADQ